MSKVFIALQDNEEARYIVQAIEQDNATATVTYNPAMIRIDNDDRLVINRASVEEAMGRGWDVQSIHVNLISLAGHVDETDDQFSLSWNTR